MSASSVAAQLGPYELISPISSGGMGDVWKARDARLNRIVALKRLRPDHVSRFEGEARAIAALNHPNICQLYDIGADYLVMEYVDGSVLHGPLAAEEAQRLAVQIADALDHAHSRGILHRDLKPANILVTVKGDAKLVDFGLARPVSQADTQTMAVIGTPAYMAPEQAEAKDVDARSDIFSFGAVLYEILSGARAFHSLAAVLRDDPAPIHSPIGEIAMRCLAKRPEHRFQTIAEVKEALRRTATHSHSLPRSVAVLPFANLGGGKDQECFGDGLAEEIINALTQIPELRVAARTSAFAFRGREQDITKIAETLRVRIIIEGSVRRAGEQIRVTAQLIDAANGYCLWSRRYDCELADNFEIQDDIAHSITAAIRLELTSDEQRQITKRCTLSIEAFDLYLRGRHAVEQVDARSQREGLAFFEQAIVSDPDYPMPLVGIARWSFNMARLNIAPPNELAAQARNALRRALILDPNLAEAHAILGSLTAIDEWNWSSAERSFQHALKLAPNSAEVHNEFARNFLSLLGRFEEAFAENRRARELDPFSPSIERAHGWILLLAREFEQAEAEFRSIIAKSPDTGFIRSQIGMALLGQRRYKEAANEFESACRRAPTPIREVLTAWALARCGESDVAERTLDRLRRRAADEFVPSLGFALLHFALGQEHEGFSALNQCLINREQQISACKVHFIFDPLREHPRFQAILREVHLS